MSSTSKIRACSACDVETPDYMQVKIGNEKIIFCQKHWAAFVDGLEPDLLLALADSQRS